MQIKQVYIFLYIHQKNDEFGHCNCQDLEAYFNCLLCYFTKFKDTVANRNIFNNHCDNPAEPEKPEETLTFSEFTGFSASTNNNNGKTETTTQNVNDNNNNDKNNDNKKENKNDNKDNNDNNDNNANNNKNGGSGSTVGIAVVGAVIAVGVVGFFVYSRKKKQRPETLIFYGNSATSINSQNQYSSGSLPREVNEVTSTNNLTSNYDNQFYGNTDTKQYNDQTQQNFDYPNYQYGGNQYADESYKIVDNNTNGFATNGFGTIGYDSNVTASELNNISTPINYDTTGVSTNLGVPNTLGVATNIVDTSQDNANYESRRESMLPGIKPTAVNVAGSFVVAYKYDPQLDDELALNVGDQIQIIEEYEDGWMKAFNMSTNQEGMAPRVCIKEA